MKTASPQQNLNTKLVSMAANRYWSQLFNWPARHSKVKLVFHLDTAIIPIFPNRRYNPHYTRKKLCSQERKKNEICNRFCDHIPQTYDNLILIKNVFFCGLRLKNFIIYPLLIALLLHISMSTKYFYEATCGIFKPNYLRIFSVLRVLTMLSISFHSQWWSHVS